MDESITGRQIGNCKRWRAWAAALARRGGVARRREPLPFEWLLRKSAVRIENVFETANTVWNLQHLHLSIPFAIEVRPSAGEQPHVERAPDTPLNDPARRAGDELARYVERTVERTLQRAEIQTSRLLEKVTERARRVEERPAFRELILVRQLAPVRPAAAVEQRSEPADWTSATAPGAAWSRPSASPPPNVEQIAENVMRVIDRRIGAWRERMGRM